MTSTSSCLSVMIHELFDWSVLGGHVRDELGEGSELLLDEIARGFLLQLASLLVDLRRAAADENLRLVENEGIEKHHRAAHIVLHPGTADRTGRRRLKGDRLAGERLVRQP